MVLEVAFKKVKFNTVGFFTFENEQVFFTRTICMKLTEMWVKLARTNDQSYLRNITISQFCPFGSNFELVLFVHFLYMDLAKHPVFQGHPF